MSRIPLPYHPFCHHRSKPSHLSSGRSQLAPNWSPCPCQQHAGHSDTWDGSPFHFVKVHILTGTSRPCATLLTPLAHSHTSFHCSPSRPLLSPSPPFLREEVSSSFMALSFLHPVPIRYHPFFWYPPFLFFLCPLFFFFFFSHKACRILVPQPGVETRPLAMRVQSPNHWTTRKFPRHHSWLAPPLESHLLDEAFPATLFKFNIPLTPTFHRSFPWWLFSAEYVSLPNMVYAAVFFVLSLFHPIT